MKLRTAIALAAACGIATGAQSDPPADAPPPVAQEQEEELTVDQLIERLGDDSYAKREMASEALWQRGEGVLKDLKRALLSDDPEVALRARELADKIDLGILPDSPPMVIELVNSYEEVAQRNKSTVMFQLRRMGAYRPMLKLYQRETDPAVKAELRRVIDGVAVLAARQQVVEGRLDVALEYLEMAPADAKGLMAWAAFHAACGTAPAELRRVRDMEGRVGALHRMALKRALGDVAGARKEAEAAGEEGIAAAMGLLLGDPLPWLKMPSRDRFRTRFHESYREWAIQRWRGGKGDPEIIDAIAAAIVKGDEDDAYTGLNALMLAGEQALGAAQIERLSKGEALSYYDSIEEVDRALRVVGIDPDAPDFGAWGDEMTKRILDDLDDSEVEQEQVIRLCSMLEARGMHDEAWRCLKPWLEGLSELEEDADELLLNVLHEWFAKGVIEGTIRGLAFWAGEDLDKWEMGTEELLGLSGDNGTLWRRLAAGEDGLKGERQLRVYLALFGVATNEEKSRREWIDRLWAEARKAKGEDRDALLGIVITVARSAGRAELALDALRMATDGDSGHDRFGSYLVMLAISDEWDEVAEGWRTVLEKNPSNPSRQAYLATSLRRAGEEDDSRDVEKLIEMLAMGDEQSCLDIAGAYAFGGDYKRAGEWQRRALLEGDPGSESWPLVIRELKQVALEDGDWKLAAALCEALALVGLERGWPYTDALDSPLWRLRLRFEGDFARAMSMLDGNRESALEMIDACHARLSSDGLIADYFLPGLRQAGLREEHDRYFEKTWQRIGKVIEDYPGSHNTLNTACWIAARAVRRLDEARKLQERALDLRPDQAAYLDTMAELYFAQRNRGKAVEWSSKAVANEPGDPMLRRQFERFRSGKFPVK
jgi:tetratricopeptide (TPR) repeat protein